MNESKELTSFLRDAPYSERRKILKYARESVSAFIEATHQFGSILQSWNIGEQPSLFEHYPSNDIIDSKNGVQFYYHSHRHAGDEHGHVHLFWHATSTARRRYFRSGQMQWKRTAPTHLFSISLDARGLPVGLFTVNQWVTDGYWFDAATIFSIVEKLKISAVDNHEQSCRWLSGFVKMYLPDIKKLLELRDRKLTSRKTMTEALSDKRLELLSSLKIDWMSDLNLIESVATKNVK